MSDRVVMVDGEAYSVSGAPFAVGEWAAAQTDAGLYIQGLITRVGEGVVTIKEEGTGGRGRRWLCTVSVGRVYMRRNGEHAV